MQSGDNWKYALKFIVGKWLTGKKVVCSAPAPPKHIVPFKHSRKTSAKNAINSPEGQMYFSRKTVEAAMVCLDYSYESDLGKIRGLFLCLKLDVYCLLAVTFVAKVKRGQQMIVTPPPKKRVSPSAACPKSPQQICTSVWSATLWTQLLPWAPLLPTTPRRNAEGPTAVDTRRGDGISQLQTTPSHVTLTCPWLPWGKWWWGTSGIFCTKIQCPLPKTIFAGALYTTVYEMPPPLSSWVGNNCGICW